MTSHYSSSRNYYSRSRDSERSRERERERDRSREWRRSERDRSRSRDRDKEKERRSRSRSPSSRDGRFAEYGGSRERTRERERRTQGGKYSSEEPYSRHGDRGRFGGKHSSRYSERSPETNTTPLIREKDLPTAAKLPGYATNHYGSYHFNMGSHDRYAINNPVAVAITHKTGSQKDLKNDPLFKAAVDTLIMNIKTKGDYDLIRKECFSDIDTKAAFLNLHARVKSTVDKYLGHQVYKKDFDKVKTREGMRKKILDTPYFEKGIESVVDQILTPKIASLIRPKIEEEVYKYLNIKREGRSEGSSRISGGLKEESEIKFKPVLQTKEFSFHDITTTIVKVTTKPKTPPPPTPVATAVKTEEPGPEPTVNAEEVCLTPTDDASKQSGEMDMDTDTDEESDEEVIRTPAYSPTGKDFGADETSRMSHSDETKSSLQIDEYREIKKSVDNMDMDESSGDSKRSAHTPTLPDGSISPIVPLLPEENTASRQILSSGTEYGQNQFLQDSEIFKPSTAEVSLPHFSRTTPPPSLLSSSNETNSALVSVSSPPKMQVSPPPTVCDDAACSSPPLPDKQGAQFFGHDVVSAKQLDDEEDTEEPLPPGEEPESYFRQMQQQIFARSDVGKSDTLEPKALDNAKAEYAMDVMEQGNDDDEEIIDEDSEEESPMFEKIGEVSPPRPVELPDLVKELRENMLHQVSSKETGVATEEGNLEKTNSASAEGNIEMEVSNSAPSQDKLSSPYPGTVESLENENPVTAEDNSEERESVTSENNSKSRNVISVVHDNLEFRNNSPSSDRLENENPVTTEDNSEERESVTSENNSKSRNVISVVHDNLEFRNNSPSSDRLENVNPSLPIEGDFDDRSNVKSNDEKTEDSTHYFDFMVGIEEDCKFLEPISNFEYKIEYFKRILRD